MHARTLCLLWTLVAGGLVACQPSPAPPPTPLPSPSPAPPPPAAEPVTSGWVEFEALPDATIYVDPASVRRSGNQAEMWVLIDYRTPQADKTGKQVRSDKLRYQYDCQARNFSILDTSAHTGPMAGGELVNVNPDPPQVEPVPAGTTAERMWARACGSPDQPT